MDDGGSEELVYTVDEVRKRLKLSRGATYEAIRNGQIPSLRIGRRILVPASSLARLLGGETAAGCPLGNDRQDKGKRS